MRHLANHSIARTSLFCALALSSSLLYAQQPPQQRRGPPPEALDACKALKSGQDCSFMSPHGTVKGNCFAPEGRPLACRPKDAPKDGGSKDTPSGPPPKK